MRRPSSCDFSHYFSQYDLSQAHPCQSDHPPGLRLAHLDAVGLENTEIVVERDAALPLLVQLNNKEIGREDNIKAGKYQSV